MTQLNLFIKAGLEFNDEILEMLKKETLGLSQAQVFSITENEVENSCSSNGYLPPCTILSLFCHKCVRKVIDNNIK